MGSTVKNKLLTRLLTMILLSGLMEVAGPEALSFFFAGFVAFLTPPMGATVGLVPAPARRVRRRGREDLRRAATMVSRDWSSLDDILTVRLTAVLCDVAWGDVVVETSRARGLERRTLWFEEPEEYPLAADRCVGRRMAMETRKTGQGREEEAGI
jgi:hypothetical protein